MDCIRIMDLNVPVIIGTLPQERLQKQNVILHASLYGDFHAAGISDDFRDTFDYSAVESLLYTQTADSSFQLIEALAEHLASEVLAQFPLIQRVGLKIDKPGAPRYAKCISIEIERDRNTQMK